MTGKKRNLEEKLLKLLEVFPAVVIIGPRQVGKTFLSRKIKKDWQYFDLESPATYERVSTDPDFFLSKNTENIILDEAQEFPAIFKALRGAIDKNRDKKGRFIITGSSSPELLTNISESLAGRVGILELEPYKFNESIEVPLSPFFKIFEGEDINKVIDLSKKIDNGPIQNFWFKGGYPEPYSYNDDMARELWMDNYINTYINRDIKKLFPRLDSKKFQRFLLMLYKLSGTVINKRDLASVVEVSEPVIKDYIDIVHGTFIWRNLTSFEHNIKKQIIKMPRGHIRDSGLLHHALKFNNLKELDEHPIVGHSFESFVIEEIIKGINATMASNWSAHYYRTRNQAEIDLVLHGKFGVIPIEVKYGIKTPKKLLMTLNRFVEEHKLPYGIIINNSTKIEWLSEKVIQIPVGFI